MAEPGNSKLFPALLVAAGALWLTLTGLCTSNFAKEEEFGGLWPIGLWLMSLGAPLLALGLRSFLPARTVGLGLCVAAAAWLVWGVVWFGGILIEATAHGRFEVAYVAIVISLWLVFQTPGALMLWWGLSILRGSRKAPDASEKTVD